MDAELAGVLEKCGLGTRWNFLLKQVDIWSVDELRKKITDKRVIETLQLRVRDNEVEAFTRLILGDVYAKLPEDSHVGLSMARVIQDDEPTVPDNHCLRHYLQNSGLDTSKLCAVVTSEGVKTLKDLQQMYSEGKLSNILHKVKDLNKDKFQELLEKSLSDAVEHEELLNKFGLTKFFPEKITLQTVMKRYTNKLGDLQDVPWCFLSKILMLDYRGRDYSLPENEKEANSDVTRGGDCLDDMFAEFEPENEPSASEPHPIDIVVTIFQCCSNFLRQIICEKLFVCKLGIPLVLPQFLNKNSLFLLWSLRNIILEYRVGEEFIESSMVSCQSPIVTCLKLGKISRSKSQLLNEILNGQSHDTFFHKNCKNGMNDRKISNGLVECALYLPSAKENAADLFSKVITFVNLRGNTKDFNKNGRFLQEISSVFMILVDVNDLEKLDVKTTLKSMSSAKNLVMIVSKDSGMKFDAKCKDIIKNCITEIQIPNFKTEVVFDFLVRGDGEKNIKELKDEIVSKINKTLRETQGGMLEHYKDLAELLNISVDENTPDFSKCQQMASELVKDIRNDIIGNRTQKLPLQCKPWQEWASLSKEEHRLEKKKARESVKEYVASLYSEKTKMRQKQLEHLQNPDKFFQTFLDNLTHIQGDNRLCYMRWLKLYLDETSRKILPVLQKQYSLKLDEISQLDKADLPKEKQTELTELATKIQESSFGVEHLMREIGQAYEAVAERVDKDEHNIYPNVQHLPQIMAELMLGGYPLEVMDGDASYVPLLWVKAVFSELKNILGNDKKIFVLSVLGIQSSGKSTLLNTMFGLQFSVAAGRCTRGVYAQLVPLGKNNPNMKYDYLLVVDTEGLRAPELGQGKIQHDNEIATLVIGLGDVTLVNIKGENVAEMEDVLQIVVHAILKMKLVNKNLMLQPSCIFLHQNVSATDARTKMKIGQQKFIETLDKVTKAAGEQEDAHQYSKFQQVINFDVNKHIHYISDLWKGDLPMASANPGYSEKINLVKQSLLTETMQENGSNLTFSNLSLRVSDLWKGILCQNFVFNFKNSVALKAYNSLEKNISDMAWLMKDKALKWLNNKANVIFSQEGDFENFEQVSVKDIDSSLKETYSQAKNKLESYFAENEEKEVLEQWRANSELKLKDKFEEIFTITKIRLREEINARKNKLVVLRDLQKHEDEIANKVQALVNEGKEQTLNEQRLKEKFNESWNEWMSSLAIDAYSGEGDIYKSVVNTLLNELNHDQALVLLIISENHRKRIENNISDCFQQYKPVSLPEKSRIISVHAPMKGHLTSAQQKVEELKSKIKADIGNNTASFTNKYANNVIELVSKMKLFENGELSEEFIIKLSTYVCQFASYEMSTSTLMATQNTRGSNEVTCQIDEIDVHHIFKGALLKTFSHNQDLVRKQLKECCMLSRGNIGDFETDVKKHINARAKPQGKINTIEVAKHVQDILKVIQEDICCSENQRFRDENVISIMRKIDNIVEKSEKDHENYKFTKQFRIEVKVHACMFAIAEFHQKHQLYLHDVDPRTIFEKTRKGTYFEIFKNQCHNTNDEQALAGIISKKFSEAMELMVKRDLPRKLAQEIRMNVREVKLKSSLLPAVLVRILQTCRFEDYFLHLRDLDGSLEKWVRVYVNNYIFKPNLKSRTTKYAEMASREIDYLTSQFCKAAQVAAQKSQQQANTNNMFQPWLLEFLDSVTTKLPISTKELSSLAGKYNISDINAFNKFLTTGLKASSAALCQIFNEHNEGHLTRAYKDSVYFLISQECKGCTARCPFCNAPCMISNENHVKEHVKHKAIEHYPLACGGMMWEDTNELLTDNCSVLVADDLDFINSGSNYEPHPYKDYRKLYPDWDIIADPTVEASPYWKWFLMKFGEQLAKKYDAQKPDIPEAWKMITFTMAKNSLSK